MVDRPYGQDATCRVDHRAGAGDRLQPAEHLPAGRNSAQPPPLATSAPPPQPSAAASVDAYAPPGFTDLAAIDPTIIQDIRYHSDHNFVGRPIDGYLEPRCLLTEQAARALQQAQNAARGKGYSLKVYDCFRPLRAGEDFKRWAKLPSEQAMRRSSFRPDQGGRLHRGLRQRRKVRPQPWQHDRPHPGGGARARAAPLHQGEPLTACTAPAGQRFPDNSVDMGTGYDCFDSRSSTLDSRITGQARQNRCCYGNSCRRRAFATAPTSGGTTAWK